jgi:hypothetical protein
VRLWKVCRGVRAWHAPQKQQGTRETLKGPTALTTRAKRAGEFNDKKNVNGSTHSLNAWSMAGAGASRRNMWHK